MKGIVSLAAAALLLAACQNAGDQTAADANAGRPAWSGDAMFPELAQFTPPHPSGACMNDREIAAEQFMKLHTELMVTGLTCNALYQDPDLFTQYQRFTVAHQDRIRDSQNVLARFLGRYQRGNQARLFDTYRTLMANNESQVVINVSQNTYCQAQRERFYRIASFSNGELDNFLNQAAARYHDRYRLCRS